MCIHDLHVLENIINLYKDRVDSLGKITIDFIDDCHMEEDDIETKCFYDFHNKCNEFINTCKSAINLIHESTKEKQTTGVPKVKIGDGTHTFAQLGYATMTPAEIEAASPGNYGNQYKIEEYYGTLTLDISDIEDRFKDLCDVYRKYKLDHMVFDIIFKGERR